jgi:uncharacterized protein YjbI with pentapeptide repeats
MTNENEIKNIIKESVCEILEEKNRSPKSKVVDILGVVLTPIVIAAVSLFVTLKMDETQANNAKLIAKSQIQSAQKLAEAQREHNAKIADAELQVQRLNQIDGVFRRIIENGEDSPDLDTKKMLIGSLTVHRETSLPFLVRIRDHFYGQKGEYGDLSVHARDIIEAVLTNKHLDFKEMDLAGKGKDEQRILRHAKLEEYNLSGVKFDNCNLYQASFIRSSLSNASFIEADLFGADFSNTKLDGANFDRANLRQAVFIGSKIEGAKFENADNLKDARFSLSAIIKPYKKNNPFGKVEDPIILELLVPHIEELKRRGPQNEHLNKFIKRRFIEILNYDRLIKNLEERRAQRLASKNSESASLAVAGHS